MDKRGHLIVLQQSPFCNIDCKYCYLPNRQLAATMTPAVVELAFRKTLSSKVLNGPLRYLWHAGEPLAAGLKFFENAFDIFNRVSEGVDRDVGHSIQTNATLITPQWIKFFVHHKINIGISLDGPEFLHDANRITRGGHGTHGKVMQSVRLLQDNGVPFNVIAVLTTQSLDYAEEIHHFFVSNGIRSVAFNIDELEGTHTTSTYLQENSEVRFRNFITRFLQLLTDNPGSLQVREFAAIVPLLTTNLKSSGVQNEGNSMNSPLRIITINYLGRFSTFCPELNGQKNDLYGDYIMGDLATDKIEDIFANNVFRRVNTAIQAGKSACKSECTFWEFCLGGAPSNKISENGSFESTETVYCRTHIKTLVDATMEFVHSRYLSTEQRA